MTDCQALQTIGYMTIVLGIVLILLGLQIIVHS